jgi:DNA-binding XRE family transcriptional regulator
MLDVTQAELAQAVGVSRPYIASIESGRANPSLRTVEDIAAALGLELQLLGRAPIAINAPAQRDIVHARCSGYVDRRLGTLGWDVRREVTIVRGRMRGWIDLLAFDPRRRLLLVIEVKTAIDDLGSIERQLDWYLREAVSVARGLGWHPTRTVGWVLALSTSDVDDSLRKNRSVVDRAFPGRAREMRAVATREGDVVSARAIALIDPRSRRRDWLMAAGIDGRRTPAPYRDLRHAGLVMSA